MEHPLICNNLQCRQELGERALVTTCSHIFCLECAERLGITGQETERRNTCPACHSHFNNHDDAVITNLSPGEEYKTTILSGLSPNIVMECTSRALSFWAYQITQDMYYQQYLYKTLAEKYSALNIRLEKTVSDANTEIDGLQHRLTGMTAEQNALRRKNEEISQAYKEKARKVLQLQELYDKVKSRAELGQIQKAASDAVDLTLETTSQPNQGIAGNNGVPESDNTPAFSQRRANGSGMNTGMPRSYPAVTRESTLWPRVGGASRSESTATPLGGFRHRGMGGVSARTSTPVPVVGNIRPSTATDFAPPRNHYPGIGITSGIRVSQPDNMPGLNMHGRHL
ncbi:hypothetical protein B0J15DRAFT_288839 [Fusarium solani]|uniref:RING-type domain-containing protein n=1 Tax=Fusarium solani TaxID=169388 RepID=A0A9P9HNI3_FUSSL|nr:uncharacterized protein B0J15DRAFT_288839 [Fusarium solani]KAH7260611.1 hypothetical protein B0J15DRAFT_288839 [Fusarium solani]